GTPALPQSSIHSGPPLMRFEPINGRDPAPAKRRCRVVLGSAPATSFTPFSIRVSLAWPSNVVLPLEPVIEPFPDAWIDIEGLLHQGFENVRSDDNGIAAGLLCQRLLVFRIMAHVAERLRELIHYVLWRVGMEPDDHIELPARAERDLVGVPLRPRRRLAVQRDIHVLHAWKIGPAWVSDDVAVFIEDAVREERDHIRSVREPRPINARRLHVEIALAPLERKQRRCAAPGVAQRHLHFDAEEIERQETAQVSARCGDARIVQALRWMLEIRHGR